MATFNGDLTLLDLISNQENDPLTGLIEDVTTYAPEFSQIPVTVKQGVAYRIVKRTALPPANFRQVNAGVGTSKSSYKQEVKEMFPIDCIINVDELIVKGDDESTGDILTKEAQGALQSVIITLGFQVWYGTSNDANGFDGLRSQCTQNVSASGTTNSTSAYLVWLHPWGVNFPVGNKGEIAMKPWWTQLVPGSNTVTIGTQTAQASQFVAYCSNINCWIGLTVGSNYSVFAVTGIDSSHAMTDKLGTELLSLVPLNRRQGLVWFMNRFAHWTLQNSRSTVNTGAAGSGGYQAADAAGRPQYAPPPETCGGYPIVVTDSLTNTESN